jgi:peptide/nickel transport system substrate-binding protein
VPSSRPSHRCAAIAIALFALAASGCASRADAQREPNTVVSLVRTDGATMNPMFAQTVEDGIVYAQLLYESLSYIGADYLPHPRLATSWTHSPDGKQWTIELRHGVRWSDGEPFTSKDVVFSYEAYLDPKTAALAGGDLSYIKRVTADGPYRVRFVLAYPSAVFTLNALGFEASILPEHVLGKTPHERLRFTDFGEHPIGTGPFKLLRWQHDSDTTFVANPYAWRKPHIMRFDVRTIFNDQSELEAMANNSADLIDDMSSTQYRQLQRIAPQVILQSFPSVYIDIIMPNTRRPGLDDPVVRRAMMYGFDRAALVKGIYYNLVPISDGLIPEALAHWHNPNVTKYPFDPKKARAILDAAGWRIGPDGIRSRGSARLVFELLVNQGSATITDTMLAFTADMKAIGIDVSLRQEDFPSMVSQEFAGNFDLMAEGFGGSVDPDLTTNLGSNQIPPAGGNTSRYKNPELDRLLKAGLTELDDAKRRVIYDKVQQIVADQVPIIFQYGRFASLARSARLALDPKTTLQSPLMYYNVEDWKTAQ